MDTTCEECGTTFETLSARRLHDCPAAGPAGDGEAEPAGDGEAEPAGDGEAEADREQDVDIAGALERIRELEGAARRRAEQRASTELTAALSQAQAEEPAAVHRLLAHYGSARRKPRASARG